MDTGATVGRFGHALIRQLETVAMIVDGSQRH
jgi:hypothetical protein